MHAELGAECSAQSCPQVCIVPKALPPPNGDQAQLHGWSPATRSFSPCPPCWEGREDSALLALAPPREKTRGRDFSKCTAPLWNLHREVDYKIKAMFLLLLFCSVFVEPEAESGIRSPFLDLISHKVWGENRRKRNLILALGFLVIYYSNISATSHT